MQFFSSLCVHLFVVLSSCQSVHIDLNGPQSAGLDTDVEWQAGGGAIHLAARSATLTVGEGNDSTSIGCLVIASSHAFIEHEVEVNISADSALMLNSTANSTLHICQTNVSNSQSLQLFTDVLRRVMFDCWINCTFPYYRTFTFFLCYGNGSKSTTASKSQVWMTSQPELDFPHGPVMVSFTEGSHPVALFANYTVVVRANRRMGLRSVHLTLFKDLDSPDEILSVENATNTNTSFTNDNGTTTLSIIFPLNITDDDVVSMLRLITYHNNKSYPYSGPRCIEIIISNGLLFSNPLVVTVNVLLVNKSALEIIHIPPREYWKSWPANIVQLSQMAVLQRIDPRDLSPVYEGRVQYNFTSPDWKTGPFTLLNCTSDTNLVSKLSSCIDSKSAKPTDLLGNVTNDDMQRYTFPHAHPLSHMIVVRSNQVGLTPWSLTFWLRCGSVDNRLLISKIDSTTKGLIYQINVGLDKSIFVYNSTLNESVTVTFLVTSELTSSSWHHFAFMAGNFGIQGYVDGQTMDVGTITSHNLVSPSRLFRVRAQTRFFSSTRVSMQPSVHPSALASISFFLSPFYNIQLLSFLPPSTYSPIHQPVCRSVHPFIYCINPALIQPLLYVSCLSFGQQLRQLHFHLSSLTCCLRLSKRFDHSSIVHLSSHLIS